MVSCTPVGYRRFPSYLQPRSLPTLCALFWLLAAGCWLLAPSSVASFLISGPPASGKSRTVLDIFLAAPDSTLLTPTSTMAEHLRHELAVPPSRILSLGQFLEPFTIFQEAPEALLHLLIAQLGLSEFPGFHRLVAASIQAPVIPGHLVQVAADIDDQLTRRGFALREKRLRTAVPASTAEQTSVTVTLPDWPGSSASRTHLLEIGFTEQRFDRPLRNPSRTVFAAPSLAQEAEQIAARILESHVNGRQFHEIGILLPVRDPYAALLESTLARFGIPAKFHFTSALSEHPAIQYIAGIVRALLTGWDHADLLTLLRMPINGLGATPEGDRLDFAIRDTLPSAGLPFPLPGIAALDPWKRDRLTPADWTTRLKTLRFVIPPSEITELQILRSIAAALDTFEAALDITALSLDANTKIPLAAFWPHAEAALRIEQLYVPDPRRNVVHVLEGSEAGAWEFRIVFVPGLIARQKDEPFLFHLAASRATEQTILSYPRFNDKGSPTRRSFFLEQEGEPSSPTRILPKPNPIPLPSLAPHPEDLRVKHAKISPTSIESFLQCPFQFFAGKTLKLRDRPEKPRDRLNILLQGSILHQALAEGSFDPVFELACRKNNVPRGYRTEAVRLELLRYFEAFQADRQWPLAWPSQTEQQFQISLTPELSIAGRIDRLDIGPHRQAIVIDYKYSPAARVRDRAPIQGGLYLLAAERFFNLEPAGMFYCALREPIAWEGWHANVPGLKLGESRTPAALRELITEAEQQAIRTFESIISGNKEVRPADPAKCRHCDYKTICRIESASRVAILTPDS